MKNYRIKIICKKSNTLINDFNELSNTKKFLQRKYELKHLFDKNKPKITVERLIRNPGKQMNIFDIIE